MSTTKIRVKPGATMNGVEPEMMFVVQVACRIWQQIGVPDLVITSGTDGSHSRGSLHYVGYALDFRRRNFPNDREVERAASMLRTCLGAEYDVVVESTHIHVEFQPKSGVNL